MTEPESPSPPRANPHAPVQAVKPKKRRVAAHRRPAAAVSHRRAGTAQHALRGAAVALIAVLFFGVAALNAHAQSVPLQGGPTTPGHAPMYQSSGSGQPVISDSGPAQGGNTGVGLGELLLAARGNGLPPYVGLGTGPYGTIDCKYDGPKNSAAGYHYLCFSPNAQGGELIVAGYGGGASPLPLLFIINGQTITPVACSGAPSSAFQAINGIVTHC